MNDTPQLGEQTLTFLQDILDCRSLHVRKALIDGYSGPSSSLAIELSKLSNKDHALDRMNFFIHNLLAAHHDAFAHNLRVWLESKSVNLKD